jgi:hypothetical protein
LSAYYNTLFISENEERLSMLSELKQPYLFSSSNLLELCNLTTSLKTKMAFITHLASRLVDPCKCTNAFMDMFRFAEEKQQVEQLLKDRRTTLMKARLTNTRRSSSILAERGGRGGAGRGGRPSVTSVSETHLTLTTDDSGRTTQESSARTSMTKATPVAHTSPKAIAQPISVVISSKQTSVKSLFGCVNDHVDDIATGMSSSCTIEG